MIANFTRLSIITSEAIINFTNFVNSFIMLAFLKLLRVHDFFISKTKTIDQFFVRPFHIALVQMD